MSVKGRIAIASATHQGLVRTNNEDCVAFDDDLGLLILADGMGGHNAGEVASKIAVDTVLTTVRAALGVGELVAQPEAGNSAEAALLRDSVQLAHGAIRKEGTTKPQYHGMGTTLIACLLKDDRMAAGHVGDSRLYRLRDNVLEQLTQDHSLIEEMVARGFYTLEEARKHIKKNMITRALGNEQEKLEVDLLDEPLMVGDILLLCSDGLTDMATDTQIGALLRIQAASLQAKANALVQLALRGGGKDNVSVVLAQVEKPAVVKKRWFEHLTNWF